MLDTGLLKAMLELLAEMSLKGVTEKGDEVAKMLLSILAGCQDIYSTLYCFRTLAALCKGDKEVGRKFSGEIMQQLRNSLGNRLGD
jgi:hypothetical protein